MQFAVGASLDVDNHGDPFMMMITPVEQYSNNYALISFSEFPLNFITIYVTPKYFQPQEIFVDNTSLENANWTTVYSSNRIICGYITHVALSPGRHHVYHTEPSASFSISVYGFQDSGSYGYPGGGLHLTPLQCKYH